MEREQIEEILQQILNNISLGDGVNHTIRIKLSNNSVFEGFRIIENMDSYILGFSNDQRRQQVTIPLFLNSTIIPKANIIEIICPELN